MAILAQDINVSVLGQPVYAALSCNAADIHYQGAIVWIDTLGGAQVTGAAADRVVGICTKQQTTTAAGQEIEVLVSGYVWMPIGSGIAAADEGELLVHDDSDAYTDNPADFKAAGDLTLAANDAAVGKIVRVTSTQMLIEIGAFTGRIYDATAAAWV